MRTCKLALFAALVAASAALGTGCAWNTPMVIAYRSSVSIGGQGSNAVSSHAEMTGGGTATANLPLAK